MTDELYFASATWLAERLRTGELSSLEVVDAYLARIEQVNPRLNAVVRLNDAAREEARRADQELATGAVRGPLHGV
ncbi:MAG: aspartyl-tRNA(Asn)/glutamyl-tRNA(Gln) amidotransferase subunit, partial [Chloroflexota bacterium]|nr:aspartyl-tRNA(Asn)/glutamyl-tRNA(Gln) amidotransferase subunit [Chloroflexota bacterium]